MDTTVGETRRLRRAIRDLVGLSALSAVWVDQEPARIADDLAEVLLRVLRLDFTLVRLKGQDGEDTPEVVRTAQSAGLVYAPQAISQALAGWLEVGEVLPSSLPDPVGGGSVRLLSWPFGYNAEYGVFVAGSREADFPTDEDHMLISVALNQAAVMLQRRRAEVAIREYEKTRLRMTAIVDGCEDAIIAKTLDGLIESWNPGAERLYGYTAEEIRGKPISLLIPPDHPEELAAIMERLKRGGRINPYETVRVRKDGRRLDVSVSISPIKDARGAVVGASVIARDVSERRRAERRRAARLAVTQALTEAATVGEAVPRILQIVCESLGWDVGALWTVDEEAHILRCVEVWRQPSVHVPEFEADGRRRTFAPGVGLPGRIWVSGKPAWISDVAADTNFARGPVAHREGLHAAVGFPVLVGRKVLGVIEFLSREVREPEDDLLEMMATVGGQVGQFLERRQAEEKLRQSEQNLADFFDNAAMGLHWEGPDGMVLRANRAELEMLGYTEDEYVGHHIAEFHADSPVIEDILARLPRGVTLRDYEARLRCKDGSIKHVLIDSNVLWEHGKFVHARCFTRDITDRKRAEEALKEADRLKDEFLATLAHELRNPLGPISNAVQILRLTGGKGQANERVQETLERQVRHMIRLVDDLLEVSRITRGKLELRKERVELTAVVASALEASRPLIEAAGHELTVTLPPDPVMLEADPVRLAQVLVNLLNNAAKYTDQGGRIWLTAEQRGNEVVVRVRDTGIGLPAEMLPHIFEMFTQVDRSSRHAQGGLGIGLTVVRSLVHMHGGSAHAHSAGPGQGSEFTVRLPLAPALPRGPQGRGQPVDGSLSKALLKCRILVVDDSRDEAESLAMLLNLMGSDVRVAHDGPAALEAMSSYQPAVVLLDIGMPGMDGYEVARRARRQPGLKDVTLIALTGWGQEEDRRRCREAGFDHHLVKPVDLEALQALLA
jgi:PAS domain S-box-containing protein